MELKYRGIRYEKSIAPAEADKEMRPRIPDAAVVMRYRGRNYLSPRNYQEW